MTSSSEKMGAADAIGFLWWKYLVASLSFLTIGLGGIYLLGTVAPAIQNFEAMNIIPRGILVLLLGLMGNLTAFTGLLVGSITGLIAIGLVAAQILIFLGKLFWTSWTFLAKIFFDDSSQNANTGNQKGAH